MSIFVAGLDLGQARDYSALCVLQADPTPHQLVVEDIEPDFRLPRDREVTIAGPPVSLALRWLERYELGTTYPKIVAEVRERLGKVPGGALLAVDATGVGRAVVDLFRVMRLPLVAITITGGNAVSGDGDEYGVPKRDLV